MKFFDWVNYLDLAWDLCSDKSEEEEHLEAALRCAISRAYYAAYHLAKRLLDENQIPISREGRGPHENLWETFKKGPDDTWKDIAKSGKRLKNKRTDVDYELKRKSIQKWREEAELSVTTADEILSDLEKIKTQVSQQGLNKSLFF